MQLDGISIESMLGIRAQLKYEIFDFSTELTPGGYAQCFAPINHFRLRAKRRIIAKRRLAHHHLVQNNAHGPPVARLCVSLAWQYLGRYVIGRADKRVRHETLIVAPIRRIAQLFGENAIVLVVDQIIFRVVGPVKAGAQAEVGQLDVAMLVDEYIVGFDVAVDEAQMVNALDRAC